MTYEYLPESDLLLKFLVDAEVFILSKGVHPNKEEGKNLMAQLPPNFLVAVMLKMRDV